MLKPTDIKLTTTVRVNVTIITEWVAIVDLLGVYGNLETMTLETKLWDTFVSEVKADYDLVLTLPPIVLSCDLIEFVYACI